MLYPYSEVYRSCTCIYIDGEPLGTPEGREDPEGESEGRDDPDGPMDGASLGTDDGISLGTLEGAIGATGEPSLRDPETISVSKAETPAAAMAAAKKKTRSCIVMITTDMAVS